MDVHTQPTTRSILVSDRWRPAVQRFRRRAPAGAELPLLGGLNQSEEAGGVGFQDGWFLLDFDDPQVFSRILDSQKFWFGMINLSTGDTRVTRVWSTGRKTDVLSISLPCQD